MVVVHIKKSDNDQFLFETTVTESNADLIRRLVEVWNLRLKLMRLCGACEHLAKHGPSKPPKDHGIDTVQEEAGAVIERGEFYAEDPIGVRTGNACSPELGEIIMKTCAEAKDVTSKDMVARKKALSVELLSTKIDHIRGAVTIAYPMGLPEYDEVRMIFEGTEELEGKHASLDILDPETTSLWCASKEFRPDQTVGERLGTRNEKTKIIARLQKKGGGPPQREPGITEDERKAMMAAHFKRQEEMKKLAEAEDEDYQSSAWADPKALKRSLMGTGSVGWKRR